MDWLRRNWPDLLIGVALVAVIGGIIATLISGGSFFPVGQGDRTASTPAQTGPSTPGGSTGRSATTGPSTAAPGVAISPDAPTIGQGPGGGAIGADSPGGAEGSQADVAGAGTPAVPGSSVDIGADSGVSALPPGGDATVVPPTTGDTAVAVPLTDAAPSVSDSRSSQPGTSTTAPDTTPSSPAAARAPIGVSADADEASYRVAVGAFGNADNAQRLAQTFQASGYPVLLGSQGNLTIVLVGPYESEAEARRVAAAVKAGNFEVTDPVVHRYEPEAGTPSSAAGAPPAASSSPAATASSAPPTVAATPSATSGASGRRLQVGAYANRESSLPQRERLEELGFTVSEDTEGSLLKLLIGPFQGTALSDAQSRLAAEGIENFAR